MLDNNYFHMRRICDAIMNSASPCNDMGEGGRSTNGVIITDTTPRIERVALILSSLRCMEVITPYEEVEMGRVLRHGSCDSELMIDNIKDAVSHSKLEKTDKALCLLILDKIKHA